MANKLISEMGLPRSIANIFAARNITTAKVLPFPLSSLHYFTAHFICLDSKKETLISNHFFQSSSLTAELSSKLWFFFSMNITLILCDFSFSFQDALSLTEFELMELLDVGLQEVRSALKHVSQIVSPPYQTVSIHDLDLDSLIWFCLGVKSPF